MPVVAVELGSLNLVLYSVSSQGYGLAVFLNGKREVSASYTVAAWWPRSRGRGQSVPAVKCGQTDMLGVGTLC